MLDDNYLKVMVDHLNKLCYIELGLIKDTVDSIISLNITDSKLIENTFDRMLNLLFIPVKEIEPTYFLLLDYYNCIDENGSKAYRKYYYEYVSDEYETDEKKL